MKNKFKKTWPIEKAYKNIALTYYNNSLMFTEKGEEKLVSTLEMLLEFMRPNSEVWIFFQVAASKTSRTPVYKSIGLPFLALFLCFVFKM